MPAFVFDIPWAVLLIIMPLIGMLLAFLFSSVARWVGIVSVLLNLIAVLGLAWELSGNGVYQHTVGGWSAPLGIELYADGLSLLLLVTTALVSLGVAVYAAGYFSHSKAPSFWPIWLM
ncbi:MAG: oxidoreductase, partial [Thiohalophilus sp.]